MSALVMAIALGGVLPAQRAHSADILDVLEKCPSGEPTCVEMIGYLEKRDALSEDPDSGADPTDDFRPFLLRVKGRLDGGAEREFDLRMVYPQDSLGCHDFEAAVTGVRATGQAALLTRQGRFEMSSEPPEARFGISSSVVVLADDGSRWTEHLAPGWEHDIWPVKPIFAADGRVLWRRPDGSACLDLETGGPFARLDPDACPASELVEATADEIATIRRSGFIKEEAGREGEASYLDYYLFRLKGTPWLVFIWGVACT